MPLTPGAYIKRQREAAGLSIADVAARLATEPRTAEHTRAEWIELIEADETPLLFMTVVVLSTVFPIDMRQLVELVKVQLQDGSAPAEATQP
ncbi:hypothetical protein CA235_09560 [Sphingomonas sp. ABOLF]|uniref:helix-turn-helix domain-containing protein n=1 Tax=Sphingomonas sp. ABOLF TaxID=1985879 RepID=UPI000F7F470C|nr:hypothetical protein [Sphingomonas sp. ABOLF]RSV15173.1 hypothetical protein CA235_09560 [Sphingomonas sp. ABOLF]